MEKKSWMEDRYPDYLLVRSVTKAVILVILVLVPLLIEGSFLGPVWYKIYGGIVACLLVADWITMKILKQKFR